MKREEFGGWVEQASTDNCFCLTGLVRYTALVEKIEIGSVMNHSSK